MSSSNHQPSGKSSGHTNATSRQSNATSKHASYMFPHASTKASSSVVQDFGKFNQHFSGGNRQAIVTREGARSSGHISSTFGNSREQRITPTGSTKISEYRRVAYNPNLHNGNQGNNIGASNPSLKNSYVNSSQSHKSTRDTHASQSSANPINAFKEHNQEENHTVPQPENLADKLASTAANSGAHKHTHQGVFKPKIIQGRGGTSQSSIGVGKHGTAHDHDGTGGGATTGGRSHSSNAPNGTKIHGHHGTGSVNQSMSGGVGSSTNSIKHIEPVRRRMVNITGPLSATNGQMTNSRRIPGDLRKVTQRVTQSRQNDENDGHAANTSGQVLHRSGGTTSNLNQQKTISRILSSKPIGASNQSKQSRFENGNAYGGSSRPVSGNHQRLQHQHNSHHDEKENSTKNTGVTTQASESASGTANQSSTHSVSNTFKRSKTSEHMRYTGKSQTSSVNNSQAIPAAKKQTVAPQTKQPHNNVSNEDKRSKQQQPTATQQPVISQTTLPTDRTKASNKTGQFSQAKYQEIKALMDKRSKEKTKALSRQLEVCDLLDMRNVQTVAEFVPAITENLLKEEKACLLPSDFMQNQSEVTEKMRSYLIDWLAELHFKFKLWPETLYVTIGIIDRYLAVKSDFRKRDLQCLGVTALHIAGKYEEIYPPELKNILKVTGDAVSKQQVIEMEFSILMKLDFCIQFPSALRFAERFGRLAQLNEKQALLVQYLCDVSLLDCGFVKERPSRIAAIAIYATQYVFKGPKQNGLWNSILAKNSGYKEVHIKDRALELLHYTKTLEQSSLQTLRKKYSHQRNQEVAKLLVNLSI